MTKRIDLFDSTYKNFSEQVLAAIRKETFGEDIGQNSWLTQDEYDRFISWLKLSEGHHALEVASGSGGPASYLAKKVKCHVTGIDINEHGVLEAERNAADSGLADMLSFKVVDVNKILPFDDKTFDAVMCIDSMNHLPDRPSVLKEWYRILRPGCRALFTDPVLITGPVTNEELALRSSIGLFLFVPPGTNEQFIKDAGFQLVQKEDVTENAALVSGKWYQSRERYKNELLQIEGEERFEGLQKFFASVYKLTSERRLSRVVYLLEK